jgi:hypothetical protein
MQNSSSLAFVNVLEHIGRDLKHVPLETKQVERIPKTTFHEPPEGLVGGQLTHDIGDDPPLRRGGFRIDAIGNLGNLGGQIPCREVRGSSDEL